MGEWYGSVLYRTHTYCTGNRPMVHFLGVVFKLEQLVPLWYAVLLHQIVFIQPSHQLAHHIRLMWYIPGCFVSYGYMVTRVNME